MDPTAGRSAATLKMVMNDIEGKGPKAGVTELGGERISIMNEEVRQHAFLPAAIAELVSR